MTREEVTNIVDKVKVYRQSFLVSDSVYREWSRILAPYDYADVSKKLDEYFQDGDNFGRYPDPYYLTRYLRTIDEKKATPNVSAICPICKKQMNPIDYRKHYDRCSSANYLSVQSKKHFGKTLSHQKLMEVTQEQFDEYYWKFCKQLYEIVPEGLTKHLLENAIRSHEGLEPNYAIEELTKEMSVQ